MPYIILGCDKLSELPKLVTNYSNILLITGGQSFKNSHHYKSLLNNLNDKTIYSVPIFEEPSPDFIYETVKNHRQYNIDAVVAIGGGSVLDSCKSISAMLTVPDSVMNYLEGFDVKSHPGTKVPFIAIPTTSEAGSEMTKNAVLRKVSPNGFKKSLRHDNFIPNIAIVDPKLTLSCNINMTVACGLDAFTHLIESYLSTNGSPITDALALDGIRYFSEGFVQSRLNGYSDLDTRKCMSYASMLGGICLANPGLGTVHGFTSALGGFYNITHGVVCATLLPPYTKLIIERLLENKEDNMIYLNKYKLVGEILYGDKASTVEKGCKMLIDKLYGFVEDFDIPRLSPYDICEDDFDRIINRTSNNFNPIALSYEDLYYILKERL